MARTPDLGPDGKLLLAWLSDRQYQVLALVYRFAIRERRYPTGKEIAEELSKQGRPCSVSRAGQLVDVLIRKGYAIRKARGRHSLQLTEAAAERLQKEIQGNLDL